MGCWLINLPTSRQQRLGMRLTWIKAGVAGLADDEISAAKRLRRAAGRQHLLLQR